MIISAGRSNELLTPILLRGACWLCVLQSAKDRYGRFKLLNHGGAVEMKGRGRIAEEFDQRKREQAP